MTFASPLRRARFAGALASILAFSAAGILSAMPTSHLLGPTGMMGQHGSHEIMVTKVDPGSPADGVLQPGDVITGAWGKGFAADARREFAAAINMAEAGRDDGRLKLLLKGGREAGIQLKVYGPFSDSAPDDCHKTAALVDQMAAKMIEDGEPARDRLGVGWLGLMATGEKEHLELVKRELPKQPWANPDLEEFKALVRGETDMGLICWYMGYQLITLGEYVLLTGDRSVMPAIETYALTLSLGQDAAGTWGHRIISPHRDGRLPGYSHINQPSLSCFIGLLLAQRCGVEAAEVTEAVAKCERFYKTYIGRGTIPYGVHDPNSGSFNNNGMSAMAGIAMEMAGEKDGARFFSQQAATAYETLDQGHASHYFNVLWSPLGANLSGPEMTREYAMRSRWIFTLYRSWDGRFTYDGENNKAGSPSGGLLLNYCLPRKQLLITGREADPSLWLKGREVTKALDVSQIDCAALDEDALIGLFGHPAPQVRRGAIWTLRGRKGSFPRDVARMIKSGSKLEKLSALGFFGYMCPPEWAKPELHAIARVLNDRAEDVEVRQEAAASLSWIGEDAQRYYDDILRFVMEEKPASYIGTIDKSLARSLVTLCADPFKARLVNNRDLFYAAVTKLAGNKRQEARGDAMTLLQSMPPEDFPRVAEVVKQVALNRDPTHHSYHNPQKTLLPAGRVLANLGIIEGPAWAWEVMQTRDGKHSFKVRATVGVLKQYGVQAKDVIEMIRQDEKLSKAMSGGRFSRDWDALMTMIEQGKGPAADPIHFEDARHAGSS